MIAHVREHGEKFQAAYFHSPDDLERYFIDADNDYPDHTYLNICNDLGIEPLWEWNNDTQDWRDR